MFRNSRMSRKLALAAVAAVIGVVFGYASPGVPAEDTRAFDPNPAAHPGAATLELLRGDVLALNLRGHAPNSGTEPTHPVFTGKLYSLATGEVVGDFVEDVQCITTQGAPCNVIEATTTMNLPEGQVVSKAFISIQPDPQRPGHILAGGRPDGNSIVSTSGIYAGRTGKADLSGLNDLRGMPESIEIDDWVVVQFD